MNDFDGLIGFAGERARTTYWFNDAGDIAEVLREPERMTPSFQALLQARAGVGRGEPG